MCVTLDVTAADGQRLPRPPSALRAAFATRGAGAFAALAVRAALGIRLAFAVRTAFADQTDVFAAIFPPLEAFLYRPSIAGCQFCPSPEIALAKM